MIPRANDHGKKATSSTSYLHVPFLFVAAAGSRGLAMSDDRLAS